MEHSGIRVRTGSEMPAEVPAPWSPMDATAPAMRASAGCGWARYDRSVMVRLHWLSARLSRPARLIAATASFLLAGVAGFVGGLWGVSACGPATYGPPCSARALAWIPLVILAILVQALSATGVYWTLPALWIVGLATGIYFGRPIDETFALEGFIAGLVLLGVSIWVDVLASRANRRQNRQRLSIGRTSSTGSTK